MPSAHSHADHAGHAHGEDHEHRPAVRLRASWLRHSAMQRLAGAGAAIALLWAAVFWALP